MQEGSCHALKIMTIYVDATHFMYCVTYYVAVPPDHLWVDVKAEAFDYISNSPHVIVRIRRLLSFLLSLCGPIGRNILCLSLLSVTERLLSSPLLTPISTSVQLKLSNLLLVQCFILLCIRVNNRYVRIMADPSLS